MARQILRELRGPWRAGPVAHQDDITPLGVTTAFFEFKPGARRRRAMTTDTELQISNRSEDRIQSEVRAELQLGNEGADTFESATSHGDR
jgi:hypothetical protein